MTSLNYLDAPIIRYRLGDCGDWVNDESPEECSLLKLPKIGLSGFRTNDMIRTPHGSMIEPFVITDAVYLLSLNAHARINEYYVLQITPTLFKFHFRHQDLQNITHDRASRFLKKYLVQVLNYIVDVEVTNFEKSNLVSKKFKYFESLVE